MLISNSEAACCSGWFYFHLYLVPVARGSWDQVGAVKHGVLFRQGNLRKSRFLLKKPRGRGDGRGLRRDQAVGLESRTIGMPGGSLRSGVLPMAQTRYHIPEPQRVRRIAGSFAWIDHRLSLIT